MKAWHRFASIMLVAAAFGPGGVALGGETNSRLEWKGFGKGKVFYQKMEIEFVQKMAVQTAEVTQKQHQIFWVAWTTMEDNQDHWMVELKILGIKTDFVNNGNKITFDSTVKDQPANPLSDFFKALVGAQFTLTITKDKLEVANIEGRKAFVGVLGPMHLTSLDAALKQMTDMNFAALPTAGVMVKDNQWQKKGELNLGPLGEYTISYDYALEPEKDKLLPIAVKGFLERKAANVPAANAAGELKTKTSTGALFFDPVTGRIEKSELTLKLEGTLTIMVGGTMATGVSFVHDQTTRLTTFATNPLEKK